MKILSHIGSQMSPYLILLTSSFQPSSSILINAPLATALAGKLLI